MAQKQQARADRIESCQVCGEIDGEGRHHCAGCGIGMPGRQAGGNLYAAALGVPAPARYSQRTPRYSSLLSMLGHAAMLLIGVLLASYAFVAMVLVWISSPQAAGQAGAGFASLDPGLIVRQATNGLLYSVLPLCAGVGLIWTGLGRSLPRPGDTSPAGLVCWLAELVHRHFILRVAALFLASCLMVIGFLVALHGMWLLGEPGISYARHAFEVIVGLVIIMVALLLCHHSLHRG